MLEKLNAGSSMNMNGLGGKTIGEFSGKEWDDLLDKADDVLEDYKKNLEVREEEALERQKKKAEMNILSDSMNELAGGGSMRFLQLNQGAGMSGQAESQKQDTENPVNGLFSEEAIQKNLQDRLNIPYSVLADENGVIEYNGVTFTGDTDKNTLCLGSMYDPNKVLTIQLSGGGYLRVNRDNLDELARAINMFSPEDINRIMRAIAEDARARQVAEQIEDEASGLPVINKKEEDKI